MKSKIVDTIEDEDIKNYPTIETANLKDLQRMIVWTKRQDRYPKQDYNRSTFKTKNLHLNY